MITGHGTEPETDPLQNNLEVWEYGDHVAEYTYTKIAPVERAILERHRAALSGRVLEIGIGAGRLTAELIALGGEVHGIDINQPMVDECTRRHPRGHYRQADMRDLSAYEDGAFDAVVAIANVLDALDHEGRVQTLEEIRRVLRPGGLLVISAHNRAFIPRVRKPTWILSKNPRQQIGNIVHFRRRVQNHRRLQPFEREEPEYALVNDEAHDYALLHYYISPDAQRRQLEAHGFEPVEALDYDCREVGPGEAAERQAHVHYVARRLPA